MDDGVKRVSQTPPFLMLVGFTVIGAGMKR